MTIIALRDGILAADSLLVENDKRVGKAKKIWAIEGGRLGVVGSYANALKAARWVENGMEGDPPPTLGDDSGAALWFPDEGDALIVENGLVEPLGAAPYHAFGCGSWIALGALYHGATAVEAVKAAIAHATGCGGPVIFLKPKRR